MGPDDGFVDQILLGSDTQFGDLSAHPKDANLILAIQQIILPELPQPEISLVCINTAKKLKTILCKGADFYSHPRFSPDGTMVSWLQWNHPHMQWKGATLHVALWGSGITRSQRIGSQFGIGQPRWGANRTLFYGHDDTGYQQLYYVRFGDGIQHFTPKLLEVKHLEKCELAGAEFYLSSNTYFDLDGSYLVVSYTRAASSQLALVDCAQGTYVDLDISLNDIAYDAMQRINNREFLVIGSTSERAPALHHISLADKLETSQRRISCNVTTVAQSFDTSRLPEGILSKPIHMTFTRSHETPPQMKEPSSTGINIGHFFFMPPTRPNFVHEPDSPPPCIVVAHGGPTRHHRPSINLECQYFTSRGYAVVLLNHVGSTGYGKAYRDAMDGLWGVSDVQDAVDCVQSLAQDGLIDPGRVGITGPSAGGYLTLQATCVYPDVWAGAVSVFGISDMLGFAETTHHLEKCYDSLLVRNSSTPDGPIEDPISSALKELYDNRSPVSRARNIKAPVLLLQGTEDLVVTPDQATSFLAAARGALEQDSAALESSEIPIELVMYEGEGHGFHLASTKKDGLERTEKWWRATLKYS